MSYGIRIRNKNGTLALTSQMPTYVFAGRYQSGPIAIPGSVGAPPIVFTRIVSSSYPTAVVPVYLSYSGGSWVIEFGYYGRAVYGDSVSVTTSAIVHAYVFAPQQGNPTGWGVGVFKDGKGLALTGEDKPLIVRRRAYIDDNTVSRRITTNYPSHHGRRVYLGARPRGNWAASVGWDRVLPEAYFDLRNLQRWLRDSSGHFAAGIPSHIYINDAENYVSTHHGIWVGPEDSRDNKRPDYVPVMLIDTDWYDRGL